MDLGSQNKPLEENLAAKGPNIPPPQELVKTQNGAKREWILGLNHQENNSNPPKATKCDIVLMWSYCILKHCQTWCIVTLRHVIPSMWTRPKSSDNRKRYRTVLTPLINFLYELSRVFTPRDGVDLCLWCSHASIWEYSLTLMTEGQACHSPCHPGASQQTGRWPELASPDKINGSGAGHAGGCRAAQGVATTPAQSL